MTATTIKRSNSGLPQLECVVRVTNIPLVESGLKTAGSFYSRVKSSNSLVNWYFGTIETVGAGAIDTFTPMVQLAEGPLQKLDGYVCKGLDLVEERVPSIYLPPEVLYSNTKEYITDHFVKPVVQRADSVKRISNAVIMENAVSTFAAEKAEQALNAADTVIDKYLPDETQDEQDGQENNESGAVVKTFTHGRRVSTKLRRRLTKRTINEVAALKKQGTEVVHVLVYTIELTLTDPKQALEKAKVLWQTLSGPEPENQARPETLEQLLVLLTRESARRVVHLANYAGNTVASIPGSLHTFSVETIHHVLIATDSLIKAARLDELKNYTFQELAAIGARIQATYLEVQNYTNVTLERLAVFLSGRLEAVEESVKPPSRTVRRTTTNNNPSQTEANGGY